MVTSNKVRVGIVGASASQGFASIAHIPALRALPQFEILPARRRLKRRHVRHCTRRAFTRASDRRKPHEVLVSEGVLKPNPGR